MSLAKFNIDNDGLHIAEIVDRTPCPKHGAEKGNPCFKVYYNSPSPTDSLRRAYGAAICNLRAITAGFVGEISKESISLKARSKYKR